jgi:hypothetical protein
MLIHSSQLAEVIQSLFISSGQTCDFCHGVLGTSTLQGPSTLWRGRAALQITASARRQRGGAGNSCRWPDGFWSDHDHLKPRHLKATESRKQALSPSLEHIQKGFQPWIWIPRVWGFQNLFCHNIPRMRKRMENRNMATSLQLPPVWKSLENPYRYGSHWRWPGSSTPGKGFQQLGTAIHQAGQLRVDLAWSPKSRGFLNHGGTPIAGWFITENPKAKWMITAGTPTYGWFINLYHGKSY